MITGRLRLLLATAVALGAYVAWAEGPRLLSLIDGMAGPTTGVSSPEVPEPPSSTAEKPVTALNPVSTLSLDSLKDLVERPLFNPTRAPAPPLVEPEPAAADLVQQPEPPPEPEAEDEMSAEDFTLLAVAAREGTWMVVVRSNATNKVFHLKEGETFMTDWQLSAVSTREASLSRNGKSIQLKLFEKRPTDVPASVQAPDGAAETPGPQESQEHQETPQ